MTSVKKCVIVSTKMVNKITVEAKDLLSPKEAARFLGITTMTLWRWVQRGKINPVMIDHAYYPKTEIERVKRKMEFEQREKEGSF